MRHRKHSRVLGRSPSHRRALYRNLVSALLLTERSDTDLDENAPKVKGRIVTTLPKAKEVRPLVERCVTIARRGLLAEKSAEQFAAKAERGSSEWKAWREGPQWAQWVAARSPAVAARRHVFRLLRSKEAVSILFSTVAPRYMDRPGGYTRILKLAQPRLGDGGKRAILEFVEPEIRQRAKAERPEFAASAAPAATPTGDAS
jgi:large subunit ribosomal protein L17